MKSTLKQLSPNISIDKIQESDDVIYVYCHQKKDLPYVLNVMKKYHKFILFTLEKYKICLSKVKHYF